MNDQHLIKLFPKPVEGEYVPITFIEFKRKLVGWSPGLKRSVYIDREEDKVNLKRVRETNILIVINHLSGKVASIELTDEEKKQFEEVYNLYLEKGGQLMYTRRKSGTRRMVPIFELRPVDRKAKDIPARIRLSEKL